MKFWELMSMLQAEGAGGDVVLRFLSDPRCAKYAAWAAGGEKVQDQAALENEDLPDDLVCWALGMCTRRYRIVGTWLVRAAEDADPSETLTAVVTYQRYGGEALGKVQELAGFDLGEKAPKG